MAHVENSYSKIVHCSLRPRGNRDQAGPLGGVHSEADNPLHTQSTRENGSSNCNVDKKMTLPWCTGSESNPV
jgi:hypothetical protein